MFIEINYSSIVNKSKGYTNIKYNGTAVLGLLYHKLIYNLYKSRKKQIKPEGIQLNAIKCLHRKIGES